jgi:CBS domain-containing protein
MYVANIMSTVIITAAPWVPASRLAELLVDENIGSIPVLDRDGRPIGIVTRADLLEEDELDLTEEASAEDLMRRPPLCVLPTTPITEAARMMARHHVHHLLVVDLNGCLAGVLSSFDVVKWVAAEPASLR